VSGVLAATDLLPLEASRVRTIVDLRGDDEDRHVVEGWARSQGVRYVHHPIGVASGAHLAAAVQAGASADDAAAYIRDIYRRIVDDHGPVLASTIAELAHDLPAAFGCAAGKDRTGVVAALLQSLLGVADEEIARRYVAQAPSVEQLRPVARQYFGVEADAELPAGIDLLLGVSPATILWVLERVRSQHGTVGAYLAAHGLGADDVSTLRARLLTAP
jgi:protein-tyrosine phosphatase